MSDNSDLFNSSKAEKFEQKRYQYKYISENSWTLDSEISHIVILKDDRIIVYNPLVDTESIYELHKFCTIKQVPKINNSTGEITTTTMQAAYIRSQEFDLEECYVKISSERMLLLHIDNSGHQYSSDSLVICSNNPIGNIDTFDELLRSMYKLPKKLL